MKCLKSVTALLLCLAILMGLCACQDNAGETTPETTVPTVEVPETTEQTQPTQPSLSMEEAVAMYTAAADALNAVESMTLHITGTTHTDVAGEVFESGYEQTVVYNGLGTDSLAVSFSDASRYGTYDVELKEIYSAGNVFAEVNGFEYTAAIEQENYLSRLVPAVMLDAALYASVEAERTDSGTALTFAQAAALEEWFGEETAQLESACGTALLDEQGNLTESTYEAVYTYGGTRIVDTCHVTVSLEAEQIAVPEPSEEDLVLETLDGPWMIEMAYGLLGQGDRVAANVLDITYSEALGYQINKQWTINTYDYDDNPVIQLESAQYEWNGVSGSNSSAEITETFRDGVYSYEEEEGRTQKNSAVTLEKMRTYYRGFMTQYLPELSNIASAKLSYLGGVYLVEGTLKEDYAKTLGENICFLATGSRTLLNDLATASETKTMAFYLAIDAYTGLPTAMGVEYEGVHTIEGQDFSMVSRADCSFDLASLDSYEAIEEEPSPDVEPEVKATPLFYHVTGENGQEMWLLGTIHTGDDRTGFLPQEIYDAFAASDALALECDSDAFDEQMEEDDELQEQVMQNYYYSDGSTTKDHVEDEELYEYALQMMKASGNYNMNTLELKAYVWSSAIEGFYMRQGYQLSRDKGVEERLTKLAEEQEKPIREVESSLFQIEMLTGYSDAVQEMMLSSSGTSQEYWEGVQELYDLWCVGDEAAMREYLADDLSDATEEERKVYEEYNKAMSTDRNAGMLDVAKDYLESGEVIFYAVGLAHLLAEDGLVDTLREAGYTVELVQYSE